MQKRLVIFMALPGKGLPHQENLCSPVVTRGLSGKCMNLQNYTLCEVLARKPGSRLAGFRPGKPVAQTSPCFASDQSRRQSDDEARGRASYAGFLTTGTAFSASHRPAAVSLAYRRDSGHSRQNKSNEGLNRREFVRRCPQSPAVPCKAGFDFHAAKSSQAPVFPHDRKACLGFRPADFSTASNTSPFIRKLRKIETRFDAFQTYTLQGFKAVLGRIKTYFAEFSSGQDLQKRLQGGAK